MIKKLAILLILTTIICGCGGVSEDEGKKTIYVTITPLQAIVEEVTGGDYKVETLVPKGASPESFEPTAKQLMALNDAEQIFSVGLINFEQSLISSVKQSNRIVNLSKGVELLAGSCSHCGHHHSHGIDPHIWTSPRALKRMVENIGETMCKIAPDSVKYQVNTDKLLCKLNTLDSLCNSKIYANGVDAIMIYHPAFTYYAHDYGIEQIAVEQDGKEPSPRQLTTLVEKARNHNITTILIQPQYGKDKLRALATECGAEIVEVDPLCEDIVAEIERVTNIICSRNE
ncbi:MAG: zinc ABC transporter substrate-binding protein [Alistipes sp.]|nr:zinc ABC transporter substrate-binding protein [Alistipes sp.]